MTSIAPTIPDLSAIKSVTGLQNATADSVIAGLSTGTFVDPSGTAAGSGPATVVDLSDHAKAVLAKDTTDQVAAKRLEAQVQALKAKTDSLNKTDTKKSANQSIFDQIHDLGGELKSPDSSKSAADGVKAGTPIWQQTGSADNIAILQAGAKLYNKSQAMQDLAKNGGQFGEQTEGHVVSDDVLFVYTMHSQIAGNISSLQDKGMTDQAQALSNALQNGTLKFQKASEVPDLNMNSRMIHFADAGGGGEMGSSSVKPTGATKAAIDGGKAMAVNMGDRGDFYITW